jgi:hypothetical protein
VGRQEALKPCRVEYGLHNFHVIEERAHLPAGAGHRFEKSKSWTDRGISRVYQYSSHRCREWLPTHFITVKGRNSYMCFVHWRHCKETPIQPQLAYSCLSTPSGGLGMLNRRLVRFPITRSSATIAALSDIRKVHFDRVALFVSAEEDERL